MLSRHGYGRTARGLSPEPQPQRCMAYLDLGWEDYMVAVEYDGDQHRVDRRQYVKDIRRLESLERMGWVIVRVVAEDHPADILRRIRRALESRSLTVR